MVTLKELVWQPDPVFSNRTSAITDLYYYGIDIDPWSGKYEVEYQSEHGRPATGFLTLKEAKDFAKKHWIGKMQPHLDITSALSSVQVKILDDKIGNDERFPLPKRATKGSAAIDLRACIDKPLTIEAGQSVLVGTGIAIYIKNPNYAGVILPRSGLGSKQGIVLGNLVGLIDSDYQGELMVSVWNRSDVDYVLEPATKFAQYMVIPIQTPSFAIVDDFDADSERSTGGFGSTGLL